MARARETGQGELRQVPRGKRAVWGAIVGLGAGLAVFGLGLLSYLDFPYLDLLEHRTTDLRQRLLARPTAAAGQVALVLIDEHSIQQMRRKESVTWPWPRDVYVPIILYLKEAGARAIVFDMLFVDPGAHRKLDEEFAGAAREAGNVVFAAKLDESIPGLDPLDEKGAEAERAVAAAALAKARVDVAGWPSGRPEGFHPDHLLPPIRELAEAARAIGFVNVFQDRDNTLRRAELLQPSPDGTSLVASLPLAAALAALGEAAKPRLEGGELLVGERRIPLGRHGRPLVRYYGREGTIQSENAYSVITSFTAVQEGKQPTVPPPRLHQR